MTTISNIQVSNITLNSVQISWDVLAGNGSPLVATGQIEYGLTAAYGIMGALEPSFNYSSHQQSLSGLPQNTLFHFRVISADSSGNISFSSDQTFKTEAMPTWISCSEFAAGINAIDIVFPTHITNDIALLLVSSANESIATPSGWTLPTNGMIGIGTAGGLNAVGLTLFWKLCTSAETSVAISDPGHHVTGIIHIFRNCDISAPIENIIQSTSIDTDGTFHFGDITTSEANREIIFAAATTTKTGIIPTNLINTEVGFAYIYDVFSGTPADTENGDASILRLFENDLELGPAHAVHDDIRYIGNGRFSHKSLVDGSTETIRFSASDNSNPITTGRGYSYSISTGSFGESWHAPVPTSFVIANVLDFGAIGNGIFNCTLAIQAAINAITGTGGIVYVPDGVYMVDPVMSVLIKSNMTFKMAQNAIIKAIPNNQGLYHILKVLNAINVNILGGIIQGDRYTHTASDGEWGMGLSILSSTNVYVDYTIAKDCWGDGFYLGRQGASGNFNLILDRVIADNNRRSGVGFIDGDGVIIKNSIFKDSIGTAPQVGIDIEPDIDTTVHNVQIFNNVFSGSGVVQFEIYGNTVPKENLTNVLFDHNEIYGGPGGYGIILSGTDGHTISNNIVNTNYVGVYLSGATGNNIINNDICAPTSFEGSTAGNIISPNTLTNSGCTLTSNAVIATNPYIVTTSLLPSSNNSSSNFSWAPNLIGRSNNLSLLGGGIGISTIDAPVAGLLPGSQNWGKQNYNNPVALFGIILKPELQAQAISLSGAALSAAVSLANLSSAAALSGSAAARSSASAALKADTSISGAVSARVSAAGSLGGDPTLEGHAISSSTASGDITVSQDLSGDAEALTTALGNLWFTSNNSSVFEAIALRRNYEAFI
jgi:parallel beta-helix repeat protein